MAGLNRLLRAKVLSLSSSSSWMATTCLKRNFFSTTVSEKAATELHGAPSSSSPSLVKAFPVRRDPKERNVQWVFLGCPGVGKGTYSSRLATLVGVPHIATGDLVREELSSSGPLSKQLAEIVNQGKLVSDELVLSLLSQRLVAGEAREILEDVTDIDLIVNLKLREDVLIEKCLGRRICSECGGNFNVANIDIKEENGRPGIYMAPLLPPPLCASKLITRSDDTESVVKERLRIYEEMSQPVEEFYRSRGKLLEFDLPGGIPESWPKLLQALNLDDHDGKESAAA